MTAWLDLAPRAFDRKARPAADALFSLDDVGAGDPMFTRDGEVVDTVNREALTAERETLLARLAEIDAALAEN